MDLWPFVSVLPGKSWQFLQPSSHFRTSVNWVQNILFLNVFMLFCSVIKVPFRTLPLLSFLSYYCCLLILGYSLLIFVQLHLAKMHSFLNYRRIILLNLWTTMEQSKVTFYYRIEQENAIPLFYWLLYVIMTAVCLSVPLEYGGYVIGMALSSCYILVITFFFKGK